MQKLFIRVVANPFFMSHGLVGVEQEQILEKIVELLKGQSYTNSKQILFNAMDRIGSDAIVS